MRRPRTASRRCRPPTTRSPTPRSDGRTTRSATGPGAASPAARLRPLAGARPFALPGLFLLLLLLFLRFFLFLLDLAGRLGRRDRQRIGGPERGRLVLVQMVLALEPGEVVDADVELVRDPGVGAALAHP